MEACREAPVGSILAGRMQGGARRVRLVGAVARRGGLRVSRAAGWDIGGTAVARPSHPIAFYHMAL